jgi:hypoxanthine-guanine phosphoribosyltransferase
MTLHETIVLFSWRTLQKYEVVDMARFHKVLYPRGKIRTSRDIHEDDKDREVLIIDNFTIYIGPKQKSNHK